MSFPATLPLVVEKRRGMENQTVVGSIGIKRIGMINAV